MAEEEPRYVCGLCGIEAVYEDGSGQQSAEAVCCGKPMRKKATTKAGKIGPTSKKNIENRG